MRELVAPTTTSNVSAPSSISLRCAQEPSQHDHLGPPAAYTFSTVRRYSCPAARAWVPSGEHTNLFCMQAAQLRSQRGRVILCRWPFTSPNCPQGRQLLWVNGQPKQQRLSVIHGRYARGHSYRIKAVIFLRSSADVNGLMM